MMRVLTLTLLVALSGCTYLSFKYVNLPATLSDQIKYSDLDFGSSYDSKLDIYKPKQTTKKELPVLVFFYGGGWKTGSKGKYSFVAESFTSLGYLVVIPDYVKYPKVKYPLWQHDAAKAVTWVKNNIDKHGGDSKNLFLAGHSSGAHIGAMLVANEKFMKQQGGLSSDIKGFAGLSGPYDFVPKEEDYKDMFGPAKNYPLMQVTNYVRPDQAPMLLLWGAKDEVVWFSNIEKLKKGLDNRNASYRIKVYEDLDHVEIVGVLSKMLKEQAPVIEDIDFFFEQYSKKAF